MIFTCNCVNILDICLLYKTIKERAAIIVVAVSWYPNQLKGKKICCCYVVKMLEPLVHFKSIISLFGNNIMERRNIM